MSEERLEKLWNTLYYDYLDDKEFNELLNYYKEMEQENKQLKSILTELEEFLTKIVETGAGIEKLTCSNILVYLKELREKYKAGGEKNEYQKIRKNVK